MKISAEAAIEVQRRAEQAQHVAAPKLIELLRLSRNRIKR